MLALPSTHCLEHEAVQLIWLIGLRQQVGQCDQLMALLHGQEHGVAGVLPAADEADELHLRKKEIWAETGQKLRTYVSEVRTRCHMCGKR